MVSSAGFLNLYKFMKSLHVACNYLHCIENKIGWPNPSELRLSRSLTLPAHFRLSYNIFKRHVLFSITRLCVSLCELVQVSACQVVMECRRDCRSTGVCLPPEDAGAGTDSRPLEEQQASWLRSHLSNFHKTFVARNSVMYLNSIMYLIQVFTQWSWGKGCKEHISGQKKTTKTQPNHQINIHTHIHTHIIHSHTHTKTHMPLEKEVLINCAWSKFNVSVL